MLDLPIEERLVHYFIAMGCQPIVNSTGSTDRLVFTNGSVQIQVVVLRNEAFSQRGKIVESIFSLTTARPTVSRLYLAAPRLLETTVDAQIFRQHGIGLLLYDEKRLAEALPAQEQQTTVASVVPSLPTDSALMAELVHLKSMYNDMESHIAELKESIRSLQARDRSPTPNTNTISEQETLISHQPSLAHLGNSNQLPSFFNNNPWLDLLSKRGREDGPIAG